MISAVIYNKADGAICKQVFCRPEDIALNVSESQDWLLYDGPVNNKKVLRSSVVDIAPDEAAQGELLLAWPRARKRRDTLLRDSDWTQLPDVPMTVERRQQWEAYRQALRDITDQADPAAIVWPTPPT